MPETAFGADDPSVAFGQNESRFVYNMASSLGGDTQRTVAERAHDAVRTAVSMLEVPENIDVELAASGLISVLEGNVDNLKLIDCNEDKRHGA